MDHPHSHPICCDPQLNRPRNIFIAKSDQEDVPISYCLSDNRVCVPWPWMPSGWGWPPNASTSISWEIYCSINRARVRQLPSMPSMSSGSYFSQLLPALQESAASTALLYGALFGFFAYATYDMTNYATLRNWSLAVSLVDIFWGTCVTGVAAFLGYHGTRLIIQA